MSLASAVCGVGGTTRVTLEGLALEGLALETRLGRPSNGSLHGASTGVCQPSPPTGVNSSGQNVMPVPPGVA